MLCIFKNNDSWPPLDNWNISMGTHLLAVSCNKEKNWEENNSN